MILDRENLFSDEQAVTSSSVASTDLIDLGRADRDIGKGNELELLVSIDETFVTGDSATLNLALQTDNAIAFNTGPTTLWSTGATGASGLTAGTQWKVRVPRGTDRYLRMYYTLATGTFSAGKITAGIVFDVDDQQIYPKGAQVLA